MNSISYIIFLNDEPLLRNMTSFNLRFKFYMSFDIRYKLKEK